MVRQLLFRVWIGSRCGTTAATRFECAVQGYWSMVWPASPGRIGRLQSDDQVEISSLLDPSHVVGTFPEAAMRKDEGIQRRRKTTKSNDPECFIGHIQRTSAISLQNILISTRQMKYDQIPLRLGVAVYCAAPYKLWLEVARTLYGPLISDWAAY